MPRNDYFVSRFDPYGFFHIYGDWNRISGHLDCTKKVIPSPAKGLNCTPIVRHQLTIGGAFLMAKYTPEEKLEAVHRYLNGNDGYRSLAMV
ncbi:MAG TPA: transposase, partial [Bacillales bacterium]|nr:transposase [Bacillales bacterium]